VSAQAIDAPPAAIAGETPSRAASSSEARPAPHAGMPPLETGGPPLSFFEFWPMWLFYGPLFAYVAVLMLRFRGIRLPTLVNPRFENGGLVGESKSQILTLATNAVPEWVAPFVTRTRSDAAVSEQAAAALDALAAAGLALPVVAKPDMGCRGAGVKLIRTRDDLCAYVATFPSGARFLLQRLVPHEGEAGVFYVRRPGEPRGRILSLTLKYFPYVIGDGVRTLRALILADPRAGRLPHLYMGRHAARLDWTPAPGEPVRLAFAGSHSRGAIFRDGAAYVTDAMTARFDELAKRLPEFHFGRFDVRFADIEALRAGRDFTILEINGAGAESTHVWDRRTRLPDAYRDLARQYRLLFEIGHANRTRGFRPPRVRDFVRSYLAERRWVPQYPATD
jgi:hypothetical protein